MLELPLDTAVKKQVKGHQYYIFPSPATHSNYENRPTKYPDQKLLKVYQGKGNNGKALLHPDVMGPAELLMSALLEYGEYINDWSMRSAVIQNGWRPDDDSQGREYLRILKLIMSRDPAFKGIVFPASLEAEAQSELGGPSNYAKLAAFKKHVAESPGWTQALADNLFHQLHLAYAPRGFNPHATGFVFDLNFTIYFNGGETSLGADTSINPYALQSAAGMWLNKYAPIFCFDSYDTKIEVWHQEYRKCGPPSIPASKIPFTA